MYIFNVKTKVKFGENALSCLETFAGKKALIVTDPFMVESGMIDKITEHLQSSPYQIFSKIVPDPSVELIAEGVAEINNFQPEIIVALGGGSAIDAAKAMMYFAKQGSKELDFQLIAIPTTSGTGSEVTSFSVITDTSKGVKYPLVSDDLIPDVAILDVELVKTVPPSIVADTGMDVLTHALEAYVSVDASDCSDALAQKAVELVFDYLLRSYKDSEDMEAKGKIHHASCMAGMAFDFTSLGINHSIAHALGGRFHIPHGRANAILLPHVIEYNANIVGYNPSEYTLAAKKYAHLARLLGLQGYNIRTSVRNLINEIEKLQKGLNIPTNLADCKIDMGSFNESKEEIAQMALKDVCTKTNPRQPNPEDIIEILNKIR